MGRTSAVFAALALGVLLVALSGNEINCQPVPVEPDCTTDADCEEGQVCEAGECVAAAPGLCLGPEELRCGDDQACQYEQMWNREYGQCYVWAHRPACRTSASGDEGWYWDDTGELIRRGPCAGNYAVCRHLGTRSEGWWVHGSTPDPEGGFITWDFCGTRCPAPAVFPGSLYYDRFEGTYLDNACADDADCFTGGCSGEVCSADPGAITTCEGLPFGPQGTCGCVDGTCIWNQPEPCLLVEAGYYER